MASTTQPCPRCHGRNPDCGTCLGTGKNLDGMATTVTNGPNDVQTAQNPTSLADVLRDDIRKSLTPESLQGDRGALPTTFDELLGYLERNPWLETLGRDGAIETVTFYGASSNRPGRNAST